MDISFDSSDDDGGGRNELFTPIRGGRKSLMPDFSPTPSRSATSEELATTGQKQMNLINSTKKPPQKKTQEGASFFADDSSNRLPKLHNSSWLGADMSPIRKELETNKKNDDDNIIIEQSDSSTTPSESFFLGGNDDTDEFSKDQTPRTNVQLPNSYNDNNSTSNGNPLASQIPKFQPRRMPFSRTTLPFFRHVRSNANGDNGSGQQQRRRRRKMLNPSQPHFWNFWSALTSSPSEIDSTYAMVDTHSHGQSMGKRKSNRIVLVATAFVLFCIGVHDIFLAYLAMRRGETYPASLAWNFPWLGPTPQSLLLFGAFCPERLLKINSPEYWRMLTSMAVPISLFECLLLVLVWTRYLPSSLFVQPRNSSLHLSWPLIYVLSCWTGQLWMTAFHYETLRISMGQQQQNFDTYDDSSPPVISGSAGWATAGVLCAVGIQAPNRRFPCFLSSIALVLLHQIQSTGSVIGCAAGAFFGWAYSGIWSQNFPEEHAKRWQREMLHRDYTYYYDALQERRNFVNDSPRQWSLWHVLAVMIVFLLWFSPVVFLLYR